MKRSTLRWTVAFLVTVASFAAATWICGALILTMRDAGLRWTIAGSLGVAVAALAALWGHSYATAGHHEPVAGTTSSRPADTGGGNNISGGTFHGPVVQARDITVRDPTGSAASEPVTARRPPPTVPRPPGAD